MACGHFWDQNSEEFKIIETVFEERFPFEDFIDYDENGYSEQRENAFQGFLAAWEFIRGITPSNDEALEKLMSLVPPVWDDPTL